MQKYILSINITDIMYVKYFSRHSLLASILIIHNFLWLIKNGLYANSMFLWLQMDVDEFNASITADA